MSLTVKHLNGDTTFLLTFAPLDQMPPSPPGSLDSPAPGTFTVLVDPWLSGPSQMWHPKFLTSRHTTEACISNLSEIREPNVVLVSQVKPDHCHEETLRQLDPTSPVTTILAEPAATKKIRSMKHFHPAMVHSLRPYSSKNPDSVIRFCIPASTIDGTPGEATIAFMPAKLDVAGVHNAIGITYRPPLASSQARTPSTSLSPTDTYFTFGERPPLRSYPTTQLPMTPPESPLPPPSSHASTLTRASSYQSTLSPGMPHAQSMSSVSTLSSFNRNHMPTPKALSVVYSPHGLEYPLIRSYACSHLVRTAALPLTLLLHSFDRVSNPWWMGGNVAAGLPGGVEIARNLMAKHWVSAHDEDKDNTGISVANVKTRKYSPDEVASIVAEEGGATNVLNMAVGEEIVIRTHDIRI